MRNIGALWIEYDEQDGSPGSARWGSPVTNEQIDLVLAYAEQVVGRGPDTVV